MAAVGAKCGGGSGVGLGLRIVPRFPALRAGERIIPSGGGGRGCISGSHVGGLGGHVDGILSAVDTLSRCSGFYSAMEREVGGYVTVIMTRA